MTDREFQMMNMVYRILCLVPFCLVDYQHKS